MAYPVDWGRKCAVTIDNTKVPGNLSNFPVLLTEDNLPSEMFDADGTYPALNGGGDIRFSSDSAGSTQLACEIVSFVTDNDPANGTAEIWVKVPSVSSSADTIIYVWYNKSGETQPVASDTYGSESVWDSNHKAVWHLNESSGSRYDSTANDNTLSDNATVTSATGKIGTAADFEKDNSEYLSINDASQTGLDFTGDITLEAFFKLETVPSRGAYYGYPFISKWLATGNQRSYGFAYSQDASGNLGYAMYTCENGTSATFGWHNIDLSADTWYHVAYVYDASAGTCEIYHNGSSVGTITGLKTSLYSGSGQVQVGAMLANTDYFDGLIDNLVMSNTTRSSDWITAEYNNQNSPSTFATAGTAETPGGTTWTPKIIMY